MKELKVKIAGISPLLMHNGLGADPLNPILALIKPIMSKGSKKQTEEDHIAMSHISWISGLYLSSKPNVSIQGNQVTFDDNKGKPIIPGLVIKATICNAAKAFKLGTKFKSSIFIYDDFPLVYRPNKSVNDIFLDPEFRDTRLVRIGTSRVMKTRPRFNDWELHFSLDYEPGNVDQSQIIDVIDHAGANVGMCDFRPEFGRFKLI